jgi:hypothetical protein
MIDITLTKKMEEMLSSMKNHKLISYECNEDNINPNMAYGCIRINTDSIAVEIKNEEKSFPFFDEEEDIAGFSCEQADPDSLFIPGVRAKCKKVAVGGVIKKIDIISDEIHVNTDEYNVKFDQAIIFHMDNGILMLSKKEWFSETINISNNDHYNEIYPIEKLCEDWSNDGEDHVEVKRTIRQLR